MVPDRERIHRRPKPPARPLARGMWMRYPGHDQNDEVERDGDDDGEPPPVGAVAHGGHGEDDEQGQEGAHGGEGVGGEAVEA
ncbi:hypothetical protein PG985_015984 [Apiospora marii]|uniref:uncharacterized protein n=1 Tax=Apiospora marii TaxID=335849 RepID=UPI00312E1C99